MAIFLRRFFNPILLVVLVLLAKNLCQIAGENDDPFDDRDFAADFHCYYYAGNY